MPPVPDGKHWIDALFIVGTGAVVLLCFFAFSSIFAGGLPRADARFGLSTLCAGVVWLSVIVALWVQVGDAQTFLYLAVLWTVILGVVACWLRVRLDATRVGSAPRRLRGKRRRATSGS